MKESGGVLSPASVSQPVTLDAQKRKRSVMIVIACTFIGALAQVLIKFGAVHLEHANFVATALSIFTVPSLFAGYCLYGVFAVLLVYALRDAELSIVYPVIALTYVWVSVLSVVIFHETMSPLKTVGVGIIVAGVAVLGRGGSR